MKKTRKIIGECQSCGNKDGCAVIRGKITCQTCFKGLRKNNKERIKHDFSIPDNFSILGLRDIEEAKEKIR